MDVLLLAVSGKEITRNVHHEFLHQRPAVYSLILACFKTTKKKKKNSKILEAATIEIIRNYAQMCYV